MLARREGRAKGRTHLAVVKGTGNGEVVHIGVSARRHLKLLNRADTALGMQDSNRHILLTPQTMNSSGSSLVHMSGYYRNQTTHSMTHITTRRTNNSQVMSVLTLLALVLSRKEVLEEVTEELQRAVLEGVTRAVEEFEEVQVVFELDEGSDFLGAERRIASVDDAL